MDVDWKDNKTFATCSSDHSIHVGEIGTTQSIRRFDGHKNEVNTIKWCPAGRLLASCSDDCTAKVGWICCNVCMFSYIFDYLVVEYGCERGSI